MYTQERIDLILEIVKKQKSISVTELCKKLYVSEATIRRDLNYIQKSGKIKRSHGGAVFVDGINNESSIAIRTLENPKEKHKIAELCASFLADDTTIFMDSSSSAGMIVPYLKRFSSISVITNGLNNALLLSADTKAKIYIPSGIISPSSNSVLGSDSVSYVESMNADIAIISCSGISGGLKATEVSHEQAAIKKAMLKKAGLKILLCDSSKFNKTFMCTICDIDELDYIITDKQPPFMESCGCKVII